MAETKDTKTMQGRGSRRHPTNKEHYDSVERWQEQHSKAAKRARAKEMAEARALRTPQEQLQRLDKLLGVGVGAKRERARLSKLIEEAKDATRG